MLTPIGYAALARGRGGSIVTPPVGFLWQPPYDIYKHGLDFYVDVNLSALAPDGQAYYVDINSGNDANAGTEAEPLRTLGAAAAKPDVVVIYASPGHYHYGSNLGTINKNLSVRRWPGRSGRIVNTNAPTNLTFAAHPTLQNVWQVTRASVNAVLDVLNNDEDGDYLRLVRVADAETCNDTPNSYAQVGSMLHVHRSDKAQPLISNTWVLVAFPNVSISGDYTLYMEHVDVFDSVTITSTAAGQQPKLYLNNCSTRYSASNGVRTGGAFFILKDHVSAKNGNDGFNHNSASGNLGNGYEIGCIAYKNGELVDDGTNNKQASSAHTGAVVIRLNCEYYRNRGNGIFDLDQSWNLKCVCRESLVPGDNINNGNFRTSSTMWLDSCVSRDSWYDLLGAIFYRNLTSDGNNHPVGSYEPY